MRTQNDHWIYVIFLTLLPACSSIPFFSHSLTSNDPIERVALEQQRHQPTEAPPPPSEQIQKAFAEGELALGMSMEDVVALWGHPGRVDSTGERKSLNQKWTYIQGLISSPEIAPTRIVYFENGRVSGWKISD